jgi:hypothetical protein
LRRSNVVSSSFILFRKYPRFRKTDRRVRTLWTPDINERQSSCAFYGDDSHRGSKFQSHPVPPFRTSSVITSLPTDLAVYHRPLISASVCSLAADFSSPASSPTAVAARRCFARPQSRQTHHPRESHRWHQERRSGRMRQSTRS